MSSSEEIQLVPLDAINSRQNSLLPYEFKIGILDNNGQEIRAIYHSTPDYVVYQTDSEIRYWIDDNSEK